MIIQTSSLHSEYIFTQSEDARVFYNSLPEWVKEEAWVSNHASVFIKKELPVETSEVVPRCA